MQVQTVSVKLRIKKLTFVVAAFLHLSVIQDGKAQQLRLLKLLYLLNDAFLY